MTSGSSHMFGVPRDHIITIVRIHGVNTDTNSYASQYRLTQYSKRPANAQQTPNAHPHQTLSSYQNLLHFSNTVDIVLLPAATSPA